jgi:hypothetical protein
VSGSPRDGAAGFGRLGPAEWVAIWLALAVLSGCWLLTAGAGSGGAARWDRPVAIHLGSLLLWAVLSVPLVRLARRHALADAPGAPRRWRGLAARALLGGASAVVHSSALALALAATLPLASLAAAMGPLVAHTLRHNLHFDLLVAALVLFADAGLGWYRRLEERRVETARLAEQVALERFAAARLRLQPRFLFRSLAAIAGAVATDPDRAERLILDLAALLRSLLDSGEESACAREELDFARAYLAVECERTGGEFAGAVDPAADLPLDVELPRRSLQPLLAAVVDALGEPLAGASLVLRCDAPAGRVRFAVEAASAGARRDAAVPAVGEALTSIRLALEQRLDAREVRTWCEPRTERAIRAGFEFVPARRAEPAAARHAVRGEEVLWSRS